MLHQLTLLRKVCNFHSTSCIMLSCICVETTLCVSATIEDQNQKLKGKKCFICAKVNYRRIHVLVSLFILMHGSDQIRMCSCCMGKADIRVFHMVLIKRDISNCCTAYCMHYC